MKIAIQGHEIRGKEVIKILESLGGRNNLFQFDGTDISAFYYISNNDYIVTYRDPELFNHKLYTLEEFEKEFPFKVGDKVIDYEGDIATITGFAYIEENLGYSLQYEDGRGTATPRILKPYKEMKERNVTLTLEKAKEWYKKGGELKEIALQAFKEEELNLLPRSWEEFCKQGNPIGSWRYTIPTKYEALYKLEHLRNCWRQGWEPEYNNSHKYSIRLAYNKIQVRITTFCSSLLTFPTEEMAEEFLKCFRDLIEQARDLI